MIQNWLEDNNILFTEIGKGNIEIEGLGRCLVVSEKEKIFDDKLTLVLDDEEELQNPDNYLFKWGDNYYYSETKKIDQFNILKYVGQFDDKIDVGVWPFLGVHGGYEILNGSRSYSDWVKKAKFIGVSSLGICEKNTLAGTIKFQLECENNKVNSIIGEEITVKDGPNNYQVKLFVKNKKGWKTLLYINREINALNPGKYIEILELHKYLSGGDLVVVFDPKYITFDQTLQFQLQHDISNFYYQVDTVVYDNEERDEWYLKNLKDFIGNNHFKPVLLCDAYYLDKEDNEAKQILNSISGARDYKSSNQHFKNLYEQFEELGKLFKEDDTRFIGIFEESLANLKKIEIECIRFNIQTKVWHLPVYKQNEKEFKEYKGNNKHLFLDLVQNGLENKAPEAVRDIYKKRVEKEYSVIADNGFIDYFLILWDIVKWAKGQGILCGIARGSAGGCLISFLLSITELDPIKFGLIFERFLNKDRAKVSVPDIDTDFQSLRRDEVKKYMESKYGINQVCSVGTYTNLKLKAAFKDVARLHNIPFELSNYITGQLDIEKGRWFDIFKTATKNAKIKDFILNNPSIIEDIQLILNQPKSRSVHACATLILPEEKPIYEWIPVRKEVKDNEEILVSEWEGVELETTGFLKEDILGIAQLDKYAMILGLIERDFGEKIDLNTIPLDEEGVYDLFKNGFNGDVFHFGSLGLTKYCKDLKPNNIDDLIAAISLYRPGAIENNFHEMYIDRKEGRSSVDYWVGTENVLGETYAVIVYQEQVMKLCQVLGGLSLVEADDVRRAMVKKKYEALHQYKERFIPNYVKEFGVPEEYAISVWESIDKASLYLFNKSHAAAYAITGYRGQWLKYKYPLQYWTAAFQYDNEDPKKSNISRYMNEIKHTDSFIKIMPPNINKSGETFTSDSEKFELYWSIGRVKQVGEKALHAIIDERDKNGEFFSLEEFLERVDKRVVNKAVITNLILCGAFDELEEIPFIGGRQKVLKKYFDHLGIKGKGISPELLEYHDDYWWQIKQKELSGFGDIDYKDLVYNKTDLNVNNFIDGDSIKTTPINSISVVAGIVKKIDVRVTKSGDEYCRLLLDCNNQEIRVTIWNDFFRNIDISGDYKIIIFEGVVVADSYIKAYESGDNHVMQSSEDSKIYFV